MESVYFYHLYSFFTITVLRKNLKIPYSWSYEHGAGLPPHLVYILNCKGRYFISFLRNLKITLSYNYHRVNYLCF